MDSFLKYQIFSLIIQLFLSKYGIVLYYKYSENEINMTEDKSIGLIMNLLNNDENDFATMIQSIIVLNYNSLKNVIDNFSLEEILLGIADICRKTQKYQACRKNICLYWKNNRNVCGWNGRQKKQPKKQKEEKQKIKKEKEPKKKEDITKETEITAKINEGNVSISMPKNTI